MASNNNYRGRGGNRGSSRGNGRGGRTPGGGKPYSGGGDRVAPRYPQAHETAEWKSWFQTNYNPPTVFVKFPHSLPGRDKLQEIVSKQYTDLGNRLMADFINPHLDQEATIERGAQATADMAWQTVQEMMAEFRQIVPAFRAAQQAALATSSTPTPGPEPSNQPAVPPAPQEAPTT
jgi:hypothetical protein